MYLSKEESVIAKRAVTVQKSGNKPYIVAVLSSYQDGAKRVAHEAILIDIWLLYDPLPTVHVVTKTSVCYNQIHELRGIDMTL